MVYDLLLGVNYIVSASLILFLLFPVMLQLIAWFRPHGPRPTGSSTHFYSCIITSYGSPKQCHPLIDSILDNSYEKFEVIVVIDGTKEQFSYPHPKVKVIHPEIPLNSKLRSIKRGVENASVACEGVIILDPDNLMHPGFLQEINQLFLQPYPVIQGRRKAKNMNSPIALTDALGEAYFNVVDRKLPFEAGSSASLAGSGMCISKSLLEIFLNNFIPSDPEKVILGEDKLLQNHLVQQGYRLAYAESAVIYDEKTESPDQLVRQRARWLNAYFENIRGAGYTFLSGLATADWNRVLFGILTLKPPVFLNITLLGILLLINLFMDFRLSLLLGISLMVFLIHFMIRAIQLRLTSGLYALPEFWLSQLTALITRRKHKKEFGKTRTTTYLTIEEVIKNDMLP